MTNGRIEWVDTLKFLGIFAIFLGHFGHQAGNAYDFVFRYHVALFFFVSGFFAAKNINTSLKDFILTKTKQILIPYYIFSLIFLLVISALENWNISNVESSLWHLISGTRNHPFVGSLWFLNCIYVTLIIDFIALKLLRNKNVVLLVSLISLIYTQTLMPHNPRVSPSWFWNIDSALSYWFFVAVGRVSFNSINNAKYFSLSSIKSYPLLALSILVAFAFFYGGPNILLDKGKEFLSEDNKNIWFVFFFFQSLFTTFSLIILNIFIAKSLVGFGRINSLGSNTLHLCGLENATKLILPKIIAAFGLTLTLSNPVSTYFYAIVCLISANYISSKLKLIIPYLRK